MRGISLGASSLVAAALLCAIASPVRAAPVTLDFSGQLFDVPSQVSGVFSVGQAFSGRIVYDAAAARFDAGNPTVGAYGYESFALTVGSLRLLASRTPGQQTNVVYIFDGSGGFDILRADGATFSSTPATIAGRVVREFNFQLTSRSDVFSAGALPTSLPPLDEFSVFRGIGVVFADSPTDNVNAFAIRGRLDRLDLTTTSIPEPGSLALMLGGLAMVATARRRAPRHANREA